MQRGGQNQNPQPAILTPAVEHHLDVVRAHERFAEPQPVGAGLLLQSTGLAVLRERFTGPLYLGGASAAAIDLAGRAADPYPVGGEPLGWLNEARELGTIGKNGNIVAAGPLGESLAASGDKANASIGQALLDRAIAERPEPRLLILGKGADVATVERWFAAARSGGATAAGFAIGRTAYWGPAARVLRGEMGPEEAADAVAAGYLELIALWEGASGSTAP